jgi:hypothetical protein
MDQPSAALFAFLGIVGVQNGAKGRRDRDPRLPVYLLVELASERLCHCPAFSIPRQALGDEMKMADRVAATTRSAAVPSLGVQLRAPPGGDVCSLARRILVRR